MYNILKIVLIKLVTLFYKLESVDRMLGVCYRNVLLCGGPVCQKLGQVISCRSDMLPLEVCNILSELTYDLSSSVVLDESYYEEVLCSGGFRSNCVRIGSGAISVVYRTRVGDVDVVLKVKRRDIVYEIERSFKLVSVLLLLVCVCSNNVGVCNELYLKLSKLKGMLLKQTDFGSELSELTYFYNKYKGSDVLMIPKPYKCYSSDDIICMSYIDGVSVSSVLCDLSACARDRICKMLWRFSFESSFVSGRYHCDLHLGNIMLCDNGGVLGDLDGDMRLCILDYGLVGKVSGFSKSVLFNYNAHIFKKEWHLAARLFVKKMCVLCVEVDTTVFIGEVEEILKDCLCSEPPRLCESIYRLERCSKKNKSEFNNNYCEFELGFSTLLSSLYSLNSFNIFEFNKNLNW